MNPKYPIYIISKGRWESRLTSKVFERINVPYHICVEPKEYDLYAAVIDKNKIYVLPENFSERGQGSIPVRNWVWEHALSIDSRRHWVIDDNIGNFSRLHRNTKIKVGDGTIFRCAEDFVDRYENVALSGMNYRFFCNSRTKMAPFYLNTRIYSCILIRNDLKFRWRGRYNEDTDLSLRVLKAGFCTVLFNAFLADKTGTMIMKGGNTDTIYNTGDNRKEFAESLRRQHPDLVDVVWKWDRWHHQVNYSVFKQKLIFKKGIEIPQVINNYGMRLVNVDELRK